MTYQCWFFGPTGFYPVHIQRYYRHVLLLGAQLWILIAIRLQIYNKFSSISIESFNCSLLTVLKMLPSFVVLNLPLLLPLQFVLVCRCGRHHFRLLDQFVLPVIMFTPAQHRGTAEPCSTISIVSVTVLLLLVVGDGVVAQLAAYLVRIVDFSV